MMSLAAILLTALALTGLLLLNQGPMDKELLQREKHWSRYDNQ